MLTPQLRQEAIEQLVKASPVADQIAELKTNRAVHQSLFEAIVHDINSVEPVNAPRGPGAQGPDVPRVEDLAR